MFHPLKILLPKSLGKHKLASNIKASLICQETNKIIKDIIGETALLNTQAIYVKDNVVVIQAASSQIISELKLYEQAIIETINNRILKAKIKGLRFLVK
jgi:nitrate reductase NapAB chaperone NapD